MHIVHLMKERRAEYRKDTCNLVVKRQLRLSNVQNLGCHVPKAARQMAIC